ncbi:MAG: cupin domain-containing protein [Nitrososphaerota archaeon]|nr:cupin domain-containing protein [Nitrososphaerota archaeon]MDG6987426.1 cupin domain-containing protein [Nitrososphaerota archaeon]
MDLRVRKLNVKKDNRGWLAELLRSEDTGAHQFGQIIVTTARTGQTKGNHYHLRKREWYCIVKGKGKLSVMNRKTREIAELVMGEDNMVTVEIPIGTLHWITNTSEEEMVLIVYTDEPFKPEDPDTFFED